jgi:transposase
VQSLWKEPERGARKEMLIVETIRKIRCAYHKDRKSIRQITREFKLSRNTVKKVLRSDVTEFTYDRKGLGLPKLGPYQELLSEYLAVDGTKSPCEQRTAIMLFAELQRQGFEGGYDSVRRYVRKRRKSEGAEKSQRTYCRALTQGSIPVRLEL